MLEKWYSTIELPLTFGQFEQLPQNPAYKYEYFDGHAWLTPRPKSYHALLDLRSFVRPIPEIATEDEVLVRPLADEDWEGLPKVLSAAFHGVQPFTSLADGARLEAAQDCLRQTKEGGEGPLVADACVVAAVRSDSALVGALLTTLLPAGDLSDWDSWRWFEPPPPNAVALRLGRPHLTWVFVSPWFARQGLGTALLDEAVRALIRRGIRNSPVHSFLATSRALSGTGVPVSAACPIPAQCESSGNRSLD